MINQTDVIVVGELNVDLILNQIDSFPEIGKEKLAEEMTLTLGSSSAIFASNLSSLGSKVSFLGKIGHDTFGDLVIGSLKSKEVNTDLIIRSEELKTGATIVLNYDEDRAMVTHAGAMEALTLEDITESSLKKARHLHFSNYFLQPGLKKSIGSLFKMAKSLGLTTSFDTQWDPEEKWDLDIQSVLPDVDVFLPNHQELLYLTKKATVVEALDYLSPIANTIAVKMSNKGSLVFSMGEKLQKHAFLNTKVVDAIGAGDSFNAGFIHKFIQKCPIEECQEFGNLTGAVSTTAAGGTTAFIDYNTVIKIAKDRFGYSGK
jgi:sugar/nucleoside kinase (ribokinase family)